MDIFKKDNVFCLITGASRGFGRALGLAVAGLLGDGSCLALVARTENDLDEVKRSISDINDSLSVVTLSQDLSHVTSQDANDLLNNAMGGNTAFEYAILIHNVGSLGIISEKSDQLDDFDEIQEYLGLNVTSVFTLTSAFLKIFQDLISQPRHTLILNITSLAAIDPFPGWAKYCSGKAARELFFKVVSMEFPDTLIFNYSPGAMITEMTDEIMRSGLSPIKDWFLTNQAAGKLIPCERSVRKLMYYLSADDLKSGGRADYYDVMWEEDEA